MSVTGSDEGVYPPMSTLLDELGIAYARRFGPENLEPRAGLVVVGNAISRGNAELEAVLERGAPVHVGGRDIKEELLAGQARPGGGRHSRQDDDDVACSHGCSTWRASSPRSWSAAWPRTSATSFRLTDSRHTS